MVAHRNKGIAAEWTYCRFLGIERNKHDAGGYDRGSDAEIGDRKISIKAGKFTLMSGSLCRGCDSFESILNRYESQTHSNEWVYITEEWMAFRMNKEEFHKFICRYGYLDRDSKKNGGGIKIRARKETIERRAWLEAQVT